MTQKSYTLEDEEFVRFVRSTHTIDATAQLSGLSKSTVKRILAKGSDVPNQHSSVSPDQVNELKAMIEQQNKTIAKLTEMIRPKRNEYEEEQQPVRKLVLGRKINE